MKAEDRQPGIFIWFLQRVTRTQRCHPARELRRCQVSGPEKQKLRHRWGEGFKRPAAEITPRVGSLFREEQHAEDGNHTDTQATRCPQ